jgi:hypothetical protein
MTGDNYDRVSDGGGPGSTPGEGRAAYSIGPEPGPEANGDHRSRGQDASGTGKVSKEETNSMDTSIAMTRLEAAVEQQVLISGGDTEIETMATALLATLEPVVHQIALDLAEQAAAEVSAQLSTHGIDVVLSEGEPSLRVRSLDDQTEVGSESLDARITLRLPPTLKDRLEVAADEVGESVNSWLVRTLASQATERGRRGSHRITGTIET